MTFAVRAVAATDQGLVRSNNEDAVFVGSRLLVIADGMGGLPAGELASDIVVRALAEGDTPEGSGDPVRALCDALHTANAEVERVAAEGDGARDGMGTTATAAFLVGDRLA